MFATIKQLTQQAGRDPSKLALVVRANGQITDEPQGQSRPMFTGSADEVAADVEGMRRVDVTELFLDPILSPGLDTLDAFLEQMERFRELA